MSRQDTTETEEGGTRALAQHVRQQKAVVVEIQGRRAVVLTKDGRFLKVQSDRHRVGEETWVTVPLEPYAPALRWGSVAAALALVIAVMSRALPGAYAATAAYVSVQINPGVTLGVSNQGAVTSVQAQDQDAAVVLSRLSLVGDSLPQAVTAIIQQTVKAGLAGRGHWIAYVVTVYPATGQTVGSALRSQVAKAEADGQQALTAAHVPDSHEVLAVSAKVAAQAKALGVDVGTYVVYLQLQAASQTPLTLSSLKGKGLTAGIVRSGDQATFEKETENEGKSSPSSGSSGSSSNSSSGQTEVTGPSPQSDLPSGVEDLAPTFLQGPGSDGSGQGSGQGKTGDKNKQQATGDQNKKDGTNKSDNGSNQGSSDNSGGALTLPQLPSLDGSSSTDNTQQNADGSGSTSTQSGSDSTSSGSN